MGCACEGGGGSAHRVQNIVVREPVEGSECIYTIDNINEWLDKVECAKRTAIYTQISSITSKQLNSYIGTLLSAKNYTSNICYFRNELEEIENFITVLTVMNLCNS